MKYFMDCEFLEGTQDKRFLGIKYGKTPPTIDLISIGMVSEDGREYYAISKDFNLWEAWNRYDLKGIVPNHPKGSRKEKVYWIRENVLKPIYEDLLKRENNSNVKGNYMFGFNLPIIKYNFTYKNFKKLINKYGKTNKQIAEEIKDFVYNIKNIDNFPTKNEYIKKMDIQFYGYYSAYDHVAFCWLFGKMIDLPNRFPMYCNDLKQILDDKIKTYTSKELSKAVCPDCTHNVYATMDYEKPLINMVNCIKDHPDYPKQVNEHNALADANWNKELYKFLQSI